MIRHLALILSLLIGCSAFAQSKVEVVSAYTDKDCYLVGERLCVRVDASIDGKPSASRVAYVEISDTLSMYAQCMVALRDGHGWAEIPLPTTMHSGCYQLSAYTRVSQRLGSDAICRSIIGVINADKLSRLDDITIIPSDSCQTPHALFQYKAGDTVCIPLPETDASGCCISITKGGISANLSVCKPSVQPTTEGGMTAYCPEIEGHIVRARVASGTSAKVMTTRLSLIGKTALLYDGKRQPDGSYLYFTSGISGNQPVLVTAYDSLGRSIPMELVSPYQSMLPKRLPKLTVYCQEKALRERAAIARQQASIDANAPATSLVHSVKLMSATPDYFYDLDEYTQMKDVREMLLEFIKGIRKEKQHGVSLLYTYNPETRSYAKMPALILLDGMPIYDADDLLNYDAHLIKYVQIYSGTFHFGSSSCCGVISFITRKGRLANYKLKDGEQLMSYAFPQDHPTPANGLASKYHTTTWYPMVKAKTLTITMPSAEGLYQMTVQGKDPTGHILRTAYAIKVVK